MKKDRRLEEIATEANKVLEEKLHEVQERMQILKENLIQFSTDIQEKERHSASVLDQVTCMRAEIKDEIASYLHKIKEFENNNEEKTKRFNNIMGHTLMIIKSTEKRLFKYIHLFLWIFGIVAIASLYTNPVIRMFIKTLWGYW